MKLKDALKPEDLEKIQRHFSWDIREINCEWHRGDGPGGNYGSIPGWCLFVPVSFAVMRFDSTDIPLVEGKADLSNPRALETVLHELFHLEQYQRGLVERFKVAWWRLRYWGRKQYRKRPHEIEARDWAHQRRQK